MDGIIRRTRPIDNTVERFALVGFDGDIECTGTDDAIVVGVGYGRCGGPSKTNQTLAMECPLLHRTYPPSIPSATRGFFCVSI